MSKIQIRDTNDLKRDETFKIILICCKIASNECKFDHFHLIIG